MFESGVVRHADRKMIVIKEEVYTHRSPESGETAQHATESDVGKYQGQSRGRGSEGKMWARVFIVVSAGGLDEVG